jgi:hypothetical protein
MIHVPSLFLAKHSPVTALAERRDRCKAEPHGSGAFFSLRGSGCHGWFCRRSVVLIFVTYSGFTLNGMKVFGCKTAQVYATHRER